MVLPGPRNIEAANQLYEMLDDWRLVNEAISSYFKAHMANTDEHVVVIKVALVNSYFSTNIREPLRVAEHILGLHGLDARLEAGEVNSVGLIARSYCNFLSFASKYAHFHNRDAFPMYDRHVVAAMGHHLQKRGLTFTDYKVFFEAIKALREQAGLAAVSLEDFDNYLWLYGQKKALDKGEIAIGKEVRTLYSRSECGSLFDELEP